ncbi:hypothetical protein SDJN03_19284, partial [Cucurbita argyrosperma subsp. sororia]
MDQFGLQSWPNFGIHYGSLWASTIVRFGLPLRPIWVSTLHRFGLPRWGRFGLPLCAILGLHCRPADLGHHCAPANFGLHSGSADLRLTVDRIGPPLSPGQFGLHCGPTNLCGIGLPIWAHYAALGLHCGADKFGPRAGPPIWVSTMGRLILGLHCGSPHFGPRCGPSDLALHCGPPNLVGIGLPLWAQYVPIWASNVGHLISAELGFLCGLSMCRFEPPLWAGEFGPRCGPSDLGLHCGPLNLCLQCGPPNLGHPIWASTVGRPIWASIVGWLFGLLLWPTNLGL